MAVELQLAPKTKRPAGQSCCVAPVRPGVDPERYFVLPDATKELTSWLT